MEWNNINPKLLSIFGQAGAMFGVYLPEAAKDYNKIMVLSADMSTPAGLDKFKSSFPDKFLNLGIAEQNMIGVGAGLASEGYNVIAEAQACFITMRSYEQIRQYVGYMQNKEIIVGLFSGFSLTYMGNTHYALEDIALMRTIPGLNIIAPCDAFEAVKAFEAAIKTNAPTYIRLYGGGGSPIVYESNFDFEIGKAIRLKDGSDIQIIATGSMVPISIKVAAKLEQNNISVDLIDMHTISPLDISVIKKSVKKIFTIEEHRTIGGLGDAVAGYISENSDYPSIKKIGVPNHFSKVGDYKYLLNSNGLSEDGIFNQIMKSL